MGPAFIRIKMVLKLVGHLLIAQIFDRGKPWRLGESLVIHQILPSNFNNGS